MKVGPGESPIEHWQVLRIDQLVERVLSSSHGKDELPQIVAIDGRSGGGKSTMAMQLQGTTTIGWR